MCNDEARNVVIYGIYIQLVYTSKYRRIYMKYIFNVKNEKGVWVVLK
jgi:hypothetical protein